MAVIQVQELAERKAKINDKGIREYTRTYHVITNSYLDDALTVRNAAGIPLPFAAYVTPVGSDLGALATSIEANQPSPDDPSFWVVTVEYSSDVANPDSGAADPLARPVEFEVTESLRMLPFLNDAETDAAVENSAGEPFDPSPEVEHSDQVLTLTRNEAAYNYDDMLSYANKINLNEWFGYAVGTVRLSMPTGRRIWENGTYFWQIKYVFTVRKEGWRYVFLQNGYSAIDAATNKLYLIRDERDGSPKSRTSLLNETGNELDVVADDPVYVGFARYKKKDFGPLSLP